MVLRGDLHPVVVETAHRVVAAVMAERKLEGSGPNREAEHLVAEADPEQRDLAQQAAQGVCVVSCERLRIPGPVGDEHAVRLRGARIESWSVSAGTTSTANPRLVRWSEHVPLDAEVDGDHPAPHRALGIEAVWSSGWSPPTPGPDPPSTAPPRQST